MHGTSGNMNERTGAAGVGVPIAQEDDLASQDIESFVPIVAMRLRACSFLALLQGNPVALCCRVGRQNSHLCPDHIQRGLMLIGSQDEVLNTHDASCKKWRLWRLVP